MAQERNRSVDVEKRHVNLSNYSYNLSNRILRKANGEVGKEIPPSHVATFQQLSHTDRQVYWKEQGGDASFAKQMMTWLGSENGIANWAAKQTDPEVITLLSEVGFSQDGTVLRKELNNAKVVGVLKAINNGLPQEDRISQEALLDNTDVAGSLIFYANYLSATRENTDDIRSLIDTLVGKASAESGEDVDRTIRLLQKVSPLFAVAGIDAQHTLGALMVAKAHALNNHIAVQNIPEGTTLSDAEKAVWDKLQPATVEPVEELSASDQINQTLKQEFQDKFGRPYSDEDFRQGRMTDEEKNFLNERTTELSHGYSSGSAPLPDDDFIVINEVTPASPEAEKRGLLLSEFFAGYEGAIEGIPQREELKVADSNNMAVFSTAIEPIMPYEIMHEDGEKNFTINKDNTFLQILLQDGSLSQHLLSSLGKGDLFPNTLLAFVLEAATTTAQRETLFKNLFRQIGVIYGEHPEIIDKMHQYFVHSGASDHLFGNPQQVRERFQQLSDTIEQNGEITEVDVLDIGMLALPFNFQTIAQRMEHQYDRNQASR